MTQQKTATLIETKPRNSASADQRLYRLSPPLDHCEYVIVSANVVPFSGPETYIFPASLVGVVTDWVELPGSYRGGLSHEDALDGAGYEVIS